MCGEVNQLKIRSLITNMFLVISSTKYNTSSIWFKIYYSTWHSLKMTWTSLPAELYLPYVHGGIVIMLLSNIGVHVFSQILFLH